MYFNKTKAFKSKNTFYTEGQFRQNNKPLQNKRLCKGSLFVNRDTFKQPNQM